MSTSRRPDEECPANVECLQMNPRLSTVLLSAFLVAVVFAAWFAPYADGELARWLQTHAIVEPAAVKIAKGEMVDDYLRLKI
jgi:hypothetical protein